MRIIKLSQRDNDFPDRVSVNTYFEVTLPNRSPVGQFLLTQGRIAKQGIEAGETIIFSYETEITHIARAASCRLVNSQGDSVTYPYYFLVDMSTISLAQGNLANVEAELAVVGVQKNIVRTQGWPRIQNSPEIDKIWNDLKRMPEQGA
jgi:hypothetical protein